MICPRCADEQIEVMAKSPVKDVWTVYQCQHCLYTWRDTEPLRRTSRQRVLVCDATKYGQVATWLALPLSEFDQIITDDGLPESASRALAKQDLSLLVAKNE